MRLHMPSAGLGPAGPKPLRPYARADSYRGLRALASLSMARSDGNVRIHSGPVGVHEMVFMSRSSGNEGQIHHLRTRR